MGEQAAGEPEPIGQLLRRTVGDGEVVDDRQTGRLAESGVHGGTVFEGLLHRPNNIDSTTVEQSVRFEFTRCSFVFGCECRASGGVVRPFVFGACSAWIAIF